MIKQIGDEIYCHPSLITYVLRKKGIDPVSVSFDDNTAAKKKLRSGMQQQIIYVV